MKTNYLFLAFSFAAITFASCGDEVNEILEAQDKQIESQDSIFTYDMYLESEITSYDGTTRATTASDWENGDVVYIYFFGDDTYGQAEYISSSKKWRVTCDKALAETSNIKCDVWFSKGVNPVDNGSYITYDYATEIFVTYYGKYSYSNNAIYINATLEPYHWRLRFKGNPGTQIHISGPYKIFQINKFSSSFSYSPYAGDVYLTVNSNGYTDYYVGLTDSKVFRITLDNNTTGISYYRDFNSNTLSTGESGCYTIPTSSNLYGWTKK